MSKAIITGPRHLKGTVPIQGSKNSAQKVIPATIIYPGLYTLDNLPNIADTNSQLDVLEYLGARIEHKNASVTIDSRHIEPRELPANITAKSTGTFLFAGALLSRFGKARVFHPGGDAIGTRTVTWHLDAFKQLGASVQSSVDHYTVEGGRLKGGEIVFKKPTVNGTVNAILASVRAGGSTTLRNTPNEPDIENTVDFLNRAGARIFIGDKYIKIQGSQAASGAANIKIIPDRNDAATFAVAGSLLGGPITLAPIIEPHITSLLAVLSHIGVPYEVTTLGDEKALTVYGPNELSPVSVQSCSFPGFSTDWGPMLQVLMTQLPGKSSFHETVFSERFKHVEHLIRMGAHIEYFQPEAAAEVYNFDLTHELGKPHAICIEGPVRLQGAEVQATDVRAGAALVLAALAAEGKSAVSGYEHVQRGYQHFAERLTSLGADIAITP